MADLRAKEQSAPLPWSSRSLAQLTLVRFREFIREPEAVFWTFVFPLLLAVGLGVAFRNKPADVVSVTVVRNGPASVQLADRLTKGTGLRVEMVSADSALQALRAGTTALVASVDAGGTVHYRYDDTRPDGRSARALADEAVQRGAGRQDPVAVNDALVHERGSRYIDFVIPGLLGMNIMSGGIWGLGFAIVEARRKHLLKRLVATPMSRAHYLASYLFSRFLFLLLEVGVLVGSARLFFDVPVRGSLLQLAVVCLVSALAFGGVGLLLASRARTIEGVSGLMNLTMMPMWVLSGVFFSASNFPKAAQPVIQALPLTATINALRGTMLQGAGWSEVAPALAIVSAWLVVSFALAMRLFRWR